MAVLALLIVVVMVAAACGGPTQTRPHQWHGAGGIIPTQEDKDAGLVGIAPGFDIRRYPTVVVDRCAVAESQIKDAEDRELARTMPVFLQAETVRRLVATNLFSRVVSGGEAPLLAGPEPTLRIECVMTRLAPGSMAARFSLYTAAAGRTKAEVEFRFVDARTGSIVMVTADRRVAQGIESEVLLRASFDDMARDLAKFLDRLSRGEAPRK
ncbi:MAG: hypothetical protein ACREK6_08550 [Candidatus Rokuibacteriota bacterium]